MIPFNFHHLYYFLTVVEEDSVSAAAKKLRIAQPTLSAQIIQFENFLGKKLFLREGKKMVLTEDGHFILSYAKSIFDLGRELFDTLEDQSHPERLRVQMGVSGFIPKTWVNALIEFIMEGQEDSIFFSLVEKTQPEMIDDLKKHNLDILLTTSPVEIRADSDIENFLISKVPIVFCSDRKRAKKIKNFTQDLKDTPIIMPTSHNRTYTAIHDFFIQKKIKPNVICEIQDIEIVRRMVLNGTGIAPMNLETALHAPGKEVLFPLQKPEEMNIFESIYLARKKRKNPHFVGEKIIEQFSLFES